MFQLVKVVICMHSVPKVEANFSRWRGHTGVILSQQKWAHNKGQPAYIHFCEEGSEQNSDLRYQGNHAGDTG